MESYGRSPCVVLSTDLANAKAVEHDPQVLGVDYQAQWLAIELPVLQCCTWSAWAFESCG